MIDALTALAGNLDSKTGLERMKAQGQEFSRLYAEFVFFRDFAMSNPVAAHKWIALNSLSLNVKKFLGVANFQFDAVNSISRAMLGTGVFDMLPDVSNIYLMSGNGALSYTILELKKFNAAMTQLAIAAQGAENDGYQTKPE